ncbi:MAG: hypothetical protein WCH01_00450 [Methylococcaceae bacterium]
MSILIGAVERTYTPLPIDVSRGFPQSFPLVFSNRNYRFRLYVNAPAALIKDKTQIFDLPSPDIFLVVQIEIELSSGIRQPIFLRKVVPDIEYETDNIVLIFPQQRIAVKNLNGQGDFGSQVTGAIALR